MSTEKPTTPLERLKRLRKMQEDRGRYEPLDHMLADRILGDVLMKLGYTGILREFDKIIKHYDHSPKV